MSRAFVKEDDAEPVVVAPREEPQRVTPRGLARLRARLEAASGTARETLERRLVGAVLTEPPKDLRVVAFGATATVRGPNGTPRTFTLVEGDDVDVPAGRIGVTSPLAEALLGRRTGARVLWHRPAGDERVTIESIAYDEFAP